MDGDVMLAPLSYTVPVPALLNANILRPAVQAKTGPGSPGLLLRPEHAKWPGASKEIYKGVLVHQGCPKIWRASHHRG